MTRREVLAMCGVAGFSGCLPAPEEALAPQEPRKTLVGGHPWVYAAPRSKNDIYGILDEIFSDFHAAGLDFIELMHTALEPDDAVERIGNLSEKHGLPVIGTSYSAAMWDRAQHGQIYEYADRMIGRLQRLGARLIGTSVGNARHPKSPDELDAQAELLRRIIYRAEVNGITVNLHNHTYEVENGEHDLRGTIERIPAVKLGPDIDWLVGAGADPVDFIKRYGDRMVYAHLRDRGADGVWTEAMGEGAIDYAAVAAALREVKFAGDMAIELAHPRGFETTRPLRESFRISREFVRKTMGF